MRAFAKVLVRSFPLFISICLVAGSVAVAQGPMWLDKTTNLNSRTLSTFLNALDRDGFEVNIGKAESMDWAEDYCLGQIPNAGYVNKAPYLRLKVPKSVDQPDTLQEVFNLLPNEAIVLIGLTPPPVNYFGFHAFLWSKVYPDGRRPMFATLGDTVNNVTISTIGSTPFQSPVALIFTPDQKTDSRIRAALRRAGYPTEIINTLVFPASILNLGISDNADELRIVMRVGVWDDPDRGNSYMLNVTDMLKVFRVTPRAEEPTDPFPVPPLRIRGTGQSEMNLMNELNQLRQAIIEDNPGLYAIDIPSKPNWYEGYDYIQRGTNPGADSRDAFFVSAGFLPEYGSTNEITLADDEFLVIYGANHVATGKSTYMSANVYASKEAKLSIGQVFQDDLMGTAEPYFPYEDHAGDLLYAYKVSRNCGSDAKCLPLSIDYECPALNIDSDTVLGLIFRMYLEPSTKVGPAMPEILYDRVIKFSPRPPSEP